MADPIEYGYIAADFVHPDGTSPPAITGTVKLVRVSRSVVDAPFGNETVPATLIPASIELDVVDGRASERVATGAWYAYYSLTGVRLPTHIVEVKAEHTQACRHASRGQRCEWAQACPTGSWPAR